MKKFLGILVIAGALVACNNSSDGTATGDSTNKMGDTSGSTMTTGTGSDTSHMTTGDTSHMTTGDTSRRGDTTKK